MILARVLESRDCFKEYGLFGLIFGAIMILIGAIGTVLAGWIIFMCRRGIVIFRSGSPGQVGIIGVGIIKGIGRTSIMVRFFYFCWVWVFIVFRLGLEIDWFVFARWWVMIGKLFELGSILTIFYYYCYYY